MNMDDILSFQVSTITDGRCEQCEESEQLEHYAIQIQ